MKQITQIFLEGEIPTLTYHGYELYYGQDSQLMLEYHHK